MPPLKITLCTGPSCTSRGAPTLQQVIEQFAKNYNIPIEITHRPCANQCSFGPHVIFNGNACSSVRAADIPYFLKKFSQPADERK
jgi:NADH:ubiquinone oxidoreductase subunit E